MPSLVRVLALAAAASAFVAPAVHAAQSAALPTSLQTAPMSPVEAMAELAARGVGELHALTPGADRFEVVVKDANGRLRSLEMDAHTGALAPADISTIFRNSIDPQLVSRLRGSLAGSLPRDARPPHEWAAELLGSGQFAELREVRFVDNTYRATLRDQSGQLVELRVDPVSGAVLR